MSRKGVWRMCDQGPPDREGAPLMVSGISEKGVPLSKCLSLRSTTKRRGSMGSHFSLKCAEQPFLEQGGLCETIHYRQDVG